MRNILIILSIVMSLLGLAPAAWAHAALTGTTPAANSVLQSAPKTVSLTFSEPVAPMVLTLLTPASTLQTLDNFQLVDQTLVINAPPDLGQGTYVLNYRVVSTDGHPVGGSLVFSIGQPSSGTQISLIQSIDWPVRTATWLVRTLFYIALFFGVGTIFFRPWIARDFRRHRFTTALLALGIVTIPPLIALQGLDALGLSLTDLFRPDVVRAGLSTSLALSAGIAFAAFSIAILATYARGINPAKSLSLIAFLAIGASLAASGHASAASPQALTRTAVFLHAITIAFWAGALLPLLSLLRSNSPETPEILRHFSRLIPWSVLVLVLAGTALAIIQLGSPQALFTTAYGRVFLAKLLILIALFLLAAFNRWRLTGRVRAGNLDASRAMVRVIVLEAILLLGVFAVVALWRFTPPPRALSVAEAAQSAAATLHIHTDTAMAEVTITPGRAGPVSLQVFLMSPDFGALDAKALGVVLSNPAAGIENLRYDAIKSDDGFWRINDLTIVAPGLWTVRLDIRISDFKMVRIEDAVEIR